MGAKNKPLLEAPHLGGRAYLQAHSTAADDYLANLLADMVDDTEGLALVAVGGYGRQQLYPKSDLDLILLHNKRKDIAEIAEKIWYPIWDRGLKLGHGVFTVSEAVDISKVELERATGFLTTRLIGGDDDLHNKLDTKIVELWHKKQEPMLDLLARSVHDRHIKSGEAAFQIEPELKEGKGGLRDIHSLIWAERASEGFSFPFLEELRPYGDTLAAARVELHRLTGRAGNRVTLDDQDEMATALGYASGQDLMLRLAQAARRVAWNTDEAWDRWQRGRSRNRRMTDRTPVTPELDIVAGWLELTVDPAEDPTALLVFAEHAARTGLPMGRVTLDRLAERGGPLPEPWPERARQLFADLFIAGSSAIDVVEDLDQFGLMERILPEWAAVRCRPQRNVLHTYTVDRHLCEAAVYAASLVDRVVRPDLLVVGTLLHDIGKGYPGDHTEVGVRLIKDIGTRMGYSPQDVGVLVDLCQQHLLLPDVATRRDLADPGTIRAVAAAVDSVEFLDLLAALTEADSVATGPATWGDWKAGLLRELVSRTTQLLEGGEVGDSEDSFPTAEVLDLMRSGERTIIAKRDRLTLVAPDEPGLFSRLAGVMAVSGLDVLEAQAYADGDMAANQFVVQYTSGAPVKWDSVTELVERALDYRVAIAARVEERASAYQKYQRRLSAAPPRRMVQVDNEISNGATVLDVHAPDSIGLLYRVTRTLAEFRLDIRQAKVQTLGPEAVDSFYLTDARGNKLDEELLAELEVAIRHAMEPRDVQV
jgi:[protein-PII] uridylyltransferase